MTKVKLLSPEESVMHLFSQSRRRFLTENLLIDGAGSNATLASQ